MPLHFHQGQDIGRRDEQQDALGNLVLNPHAKLYVLADGMGGQQGGRLASTTVVDAFLTFFQHRGDGVDWPQALEQALNTANSALAEQLRARPDLAGMGTTVIAVVVDELRHRYHYISVGDSPLYGLKTNRLQRINANHAFAEDLKKWQAAGEISAEEAARHPARHAVTSAVMGKDIPLTDCGSGDFHAGDWLLLASDGVQTLSEAPGGEIETILAGSGHAEEKVGRLLAAVKAKALPQQDNTSLLLVQAAGSESVSETGTATVLASRPSAGTERRWRPLLLGTLAAGGILAATWWWLRPMPEPAETPVSASGLPAIPALPASAALPPPAETPASEAAAASGTARHPPDR
ncbi:MAG: protein phosphatase 2C domain-containing protein [Eikenella sp.]|nr:protein phosphatase 2C domain-containing protein [Eikenella sp.]